MRARSFHFKNNGLAKCATTQLDLFNHSVFEHTVAARLLCIRRAPKARCMMDSRQLKGLHIAAASSIQQKGDTWVVPSERTSKKYTVRFTPLHQTCTCPDYEARQQKCKHVFAVERLLYPQQVAVRLCLLKGRHTSRNGTNTTSRKSTRKHAS